MMFALLIILGGGVLGGLVLSEKYKKARYFKQIIRLATSPLSGDISQVVNLKALEDATLAQRLTSTGLNFYWQLGSYAALKLGVIVTLCVLVSWYLNQTYLKMNQLSVSLVCVVTGTLICMSWLQTRERKQFEDIFPDALTMLASAVSAGEGLMQAIMFVGRTLEGDVGREFKKMGERLQVGEQADAVFTKSCQRFPYPSFRFFVITMRTNLQHGGQLKDVMSKLNRVMFSARAIEKKKFALTSEARISAKIVGVLPFFFLALLQYISPENFEFVMFNPEGRGILYYVILSECVGMGIIWLLMRGVR
ncbi:pilus assembly protein TadB [Vibrio lentus]|uniref:type II secretion system F family protein n=1 Tax=Vibrio lentus TaxID=136468 RepID=UPI000C84A6A7|nr:type II secretion system F family protein [Vibrio lentus]MCB5464379.1 pilus assembly protein TadB [Vibrio lentus]MCB5464515.1 pilus assembly protein TadB [Vibrio lentus]MCC4853583.1 type II secretion system F family protein [Vibrio lentus]MCC5534798.1 pilus assembly protein TadB [Vibrio lentus]MCC5539713.1 pilus assembly protein TadB [Vibrio lentus]